MDIQCVNILYVGDVERGRALLTAAERQSWYVYLPADLLEALAMQVFYYPHVVVIDPINQPLLALEAYQHLNSVQATIIRLTDAVQPPVDANVHHLPLSADRETILAAVEGVLERQPHRF
jgi:hypothetical protein